MILRCCELVCCRDCMLVHIKEFNEKRAIQINKIQCLNHACNSLLQRDVLIYSFGEQYVVETEERETKRDKMICTNKLSILSNQRKQAQASQLPPSMAPIPEEQTAPLAKESEKQRQAVADEQYHSGEEVVHSDEMDAGFSSGEEAGVQP